MFHVLAFQKRGLPHAHLALRVEPQQQTTDDINKVISAEVPPAPDDSDDQCYRELILQQHGYYFCSLTKSVKRLGYTMYFFKHVHSVFVNGLMKEQWRSLIKTAAL